MNNEERKELAISKGLIIGDDFYLYRYVLDTYSSTFQKLLNNIIDFKAFDDAINNSGLYFAVSKNAKKIWDKSVINSDYLYVINQYYVEKLSNEDLDVLKNRNASDEDIMEVVKRTYKDVLTKKDGVSIRINGYNKPIESGSIVFKVVCGQNTDGEYDYIDNMKKQKDFIDDLSNQTSEEINDKLDIPCYIIMDKMV